MALRTVPTVAWSAESRWSPRPASAAALLTGLWVFGTGDALMINGNLGTGPWAALSTGVARRSHLDIGWATIAISFLVLVAWIPMRQRPGLGTVANVVVIGVSVSVMTKILPAPDAVVLQLAFMSAGVLVVAAGTALYLTAHHGAGPRDGLTTGISARFGLPIARVRFAVEVSVLVLAALLRGEIGVGTVVFAVCVGHVLAFMLRKLSRWTV